MDEFHRGLPGHGLDPPYPGGDAAFRDDFEVADVSGALNVGAPAKFKGEVSDPYDPHLFPVFFPEKGHGPLVYRLLVAHELYFHWKVVPDAGVDEVFQGKDLFQSEGFKMGEVKAEPLRGHQGACLVHVVSEKAP